MDLSILILYKFIGSLCFYLGFICLFLYVHFIKKYTFPIYLMHYYIIEILNRNLHLTNYTKSIFYRLGMPFIVIPITIIAALIRKLRLGKKVLP
ncbi:hypothetical protein [Catenibacterium mitsuokai]|uniref:hypothetical protein n=2 Tax=Catenibacterium mitsuokai TaxID=100886 RepID=UPI003F8A3E10